MNKVTDQAKFERVYQRFFDCNAIMLTFGQRNMRKQRKKIRDYCRKHHLISGNFRYLNMCIDSLEKTLERKGEKDLENLRPLMELFPAMNMLNGMPLNETEIKMLAKHA